MVFDEPFHRLGLSRLNPGEQVFRVERPLPIVSRRIIRPMKPPMRREILADLDLEVDFFVKAHADFGFRYRCRHRLCRIFIRNHL